MSPEGKRGLKFKHKIGEKEGATETAIQQRREKERQNETQGVKRS